MKLLCPHIETHFCPLYVASHDCDGLGCFDDLEAPCKVERGEMDYDASVAALDDPVMVAELAKEEHAERERRMGPAKFWLNGLH